MIKHLYGELGGEIFELGMVSELDGDIGTQAGQLGHELRLDCIWAQDQLESLQSGYVSKRDRTLKPIWKQTEKDRRKWRAEGNAVKIVQVLKHEGSRTSWTWRVIQSGKIKVGKADTREAALEAARMTEL